MGQKQEREEKASLIAANFDSPALEKVALLLSLGQALGPTTANLFQGGRTKTAIRDDKGLQFFRGTAKQQEAKSLFNFKKTYYPLRAKRVGR